MVQKAKKLKKYFFPSICIHDFVRISKTYPLQSLKIKKTFKDGSGYKIRGIPVFFKIIRLQQKKEFFFNQTSA